MGLGEEEEEEGCVRLVVGEGTVAMVWCGVFVGLCKKYAPKASPIAPRPPSR